MKKYKVDMESIKEHGKQLFKFRGGEGQKNNAICGGMYTHTQQRQYPDVSRRVENNDASLNITTRISNTCIYILYRTKRERVSQCPMGMS